MALPAGTVVETTSEKGKTVSFKKSAGTADGTKRSIEAAVTFEKGESGNPDLIKALAISLHNDKSSITLEAAQEKLKEILDNPKKRAVPIKRVEGTTAAPAAAPKGFKISDVQREVGAQGRAESLFYNADVVTNAYKTESTLEAAIEKALVKMRANKPAKNVVAMARITEAQRALAEKKAVRDAEAAEAQRALAEKKAVRDAEAAAKTNVEAAARIARKLGGPAGPAGPNASWAAEVEEEHERCIAACNSKKAEKLAAGRAAYTRKRTAKPAGPVGNGAPAENNIGEPLSQEEAWAMFTRDLPADIVAYASTPKQKAALEKTVHYKTWVGLYAVSKSKGKAQLANYKKSVQKAVGKKLSEVKTALTAVPIGNGASRKRRGGGSRKNRKTRRRRN